MEKIPMFFVALTCLINKNAYFSDAPQFPEQKSGELKVFTVEEGKDLVVNLTAQANPGEVTYKWTNPDRATIPNAGNALPDARSVWVLAVKSRSCSLTVHH